MAFRRHAHLLLEPEVLAEQPAQQLHIRSDFCHHNNPDIERSRVSAALIRHDEFGVLLEHAGA